jgi:hypothetical protein
MDYTDRQHVNEFESAAFFVWMIMMNKWTSETMQTWLQNKVIRSNILSSGEEAYKIVINYETKDLKRGNSGLFEETTILIVE